MSFPNDGRNHHNAIKNENSTNEFLQEHAYKIYKGVEQGKYVVEALGGTKNKEDNIVVCDNGRTINVSDKQKKEGLGGSFDYTNTSKPITVMLKEGNKCVKKIQDVYDSLKRDKQLPLEEKTDELVESYRELIKDASYAFLSNLTSDDIINLIKRFLIKPNEKMEMFITDSKMNKRYTFPFMKHPVVKLIENGFTASIDVKVRRMSGKIIFSKGDEEVYVGLRIRVHTNNGANALLKKSSMFVLKFQQDSVAKLINKIGVPVIEI